MGLVVNRGAGAGHDKAAAPFQRLPAVAAYIAKPMTVVDLAQCRQHLHAHFTVGADDAGKVLDGENATLADPAQQSTSSTFGTALTRRRREQRAFRCDGADHTRVEPAG